MLPHRLINFSVLLLAVATLLPAGCRRREGNMDIQPKKQPYQPSQFFYDQSSARPLVPGTVARGYLYEDDHLFRGMIAGQPAESFPFPITRQVLLRGQERYDIYCAVCHGPRGYANGMIVQRGFTPPPSYHIPRLREAPPGHFYDVITNGWGAMYSYADQIPPADRWAIVAYVRALQLSQNAQVSDLPQPVEQELQQRPPEKDFPIPQENQ